MAKPRMLAEEQDRVPSHIPHTDVTEDKGLQVYKEVWGRRAATLAEALLNKQK